MTAAVAFRGVTRRFGPVAAVEGLDLEIAEGELFALLGPSGSGKTTCLRLVAGFERPDEGEVRLFGAGMAGVPPHRRPVSTVFQDYALFPHLSVLGNVAYGPRIAGAARAERLGRAEAALAMVALAGFGGRRPSELSGGQRQRVALARALANRPRLLLLDEPLGALDPRLRERMQEEIGALQRRLGITFLLVTHDQAEALSTADRVGVIEAGRLRQVGTPQEVHERPRTRFVAEFVGASNVLAPEVTRAFGGPPAWASLRPEALRLAPPEGAGVAGVVTGARYLGTARRVVVALDPPPPGPPPREGSGAVAVLVPGGAAAPPPGSRVGLAWDAGALHLLEG